MIEHRILVFFLLAIFCTTSFSMDLDAKLSLIKNVYQLEPKNCDSNSFHEISQEELLAGKVLFESVSLSGDRDISCKTCHLDKFASTDGLPIAVGVGGQGEGKDRLYNDNGTLVQRNVLSLKGRANPKFTAYFWDGKVQVEKNRIVTQFGDEINGKFTSPLSLASILPLVERDEFLGKTNPLFANDIQYRVGNKLYYHRYVAISEALQKRFLNPSTEEDRKVSKALKSANVPLEQMELSHIGELMAKFISSKFKCETSAWDKYLSGIKSAITDKQKNGAILFYGKGRCASCHSGQFFSDFQYYSIGAPQGEFGPHSRHRDIGRAGVTNRVEDLYLFRTPPLTDVSHTAPYGHNGAFDNLEDVVVHHFNPLEFYINHKDYYDSDYFLISKFIDARDDILSTIDIKNKEELEQLLDFLTTL